MGSRSTPLLLLIVVATLAAACSDNDGTPGADGPASATIVTTTSTTTSTTSSTTTSTATSTISPTAPTAQGPASTTAEPDTAEPAADPTTTAVSSVTTTTITVTPPPTTPPRVGDPVVASEPLAEFDEPVDLAVRPGDDRFYVVEQPGRVVRYDGSERVTALDVSDRIRAGGEQGLLGLAFSPDGNLAYVNYTDTSDATTIVEFPVDADGIFDRGAARTVLTVRQPFSNHNAGDLEFGPDGMLFIPLGDGGSGGDPERNGSDPTTLLGSLLRIDPSPTDGAAYSIPPDNPFADGVGGAPEVWAWGLRNPWKIAFDPVTDELWIADVGQNAFEEVDLVAPADGFTAGRGADFGWSAFEGTERFNTDVADSGRFTPPVLTYSHADGCSISGGAPYRGTAIAALEPAYVYSDFCTSTIWALDVAGGRNLTLLTGFDNVASIRVGPDRELYVLERSGTIHRLTQG